MKSKLLISITLPIMVMLAGCGQMPQYTAPPPAAPPSNTNSINIAGLSFSPDSTTILAGTTVTWNNNDSTAHTVTSISGPVSFDSGNLSPGAAYSFTFTTAGTYSYLCQIHTNMTGTVTVN